jgi:hypothetical protein
LNTSDYWYNETHRLVFTIGNTSYDTWNTWHIIPIKKPVPPIPELEDAGLITVNYIDGSKKTLSTKGLYNRLKGYGDGSAEFIITAADPDPVYNTILAALHGQKGSVQFLDFPSGTQVYYGTFTIDKYDPQDNYSTITIGYKVKATNDNDIVDKNDITDALAHGVTFTIGNTSKRTWTDWSMVSEEPVAVEPPQVKTNYVQVPGANGSIDLTNAVAGHVLYDNVEGNIQFVVTTADPISTYYTVMQFLHGMRGTMTPADGGGTFTGRFSVDGYSVSDGQFKITIGYNVIPYINRGS